VLEFRILGPLEVWDDGGERPLGGTKQRAVLAILLLDAGRVVSTDRLIDLLWGDRPPATAAASLQNFVSQLRKTLGTEVVRTTAPGYRLEIAPEQLDLERFRRIVEAAKSRTPEERAAELRLALDLWRGPALADLAFESFAEQEASRLDELRLAALEDRISADLECGRYAELIGEVESLVRAYPLRERLRGQLMLALYRSGRQAEALAVYQETRRDPGHLHAGRRDHLCREQRADRPAAQDARLHYTASATSRSLGIGENRSQITPASAPRTPIQSAAWRPRTVPSAPPSSAPIGRIP
jgi:DNA-binding SARP family transcriptional activator